MSFLRVSLRILFILVGLCGAAAIGQQPGTATRDLSVSPDTPKPPQAAPAIPRSYALVIGISHYQNLSAANQLQYSDRDAQEVYATLISAEGGQFPPENVHRLVDETATLANIRHELEEWLPSVSGPQDRVLIYFAGHGFLSQGKGYLGPYDLDPQKISQTAYPMEELGKAIGERIQAKWKVLITDACHSGAITPADDAAQLNRELLGLRTSLFSLTASRDREQSFEGKQWNNGHGVFTYFVVKGLEGEADASGDGVVTADELAEYVHTNVRNATGGRQNPTSERGSFDPNMVLAYNVSRRRTAEPTVAKYGTLILETNMDGTEVWIDGKDQGIVNRTAPKRLDGMLPGPHIVKGVHSGYEPDGPREEQVYPGQETTVSLRLLIPRRPTRAAQAPFERGLEHYNRGTEADYRRATAEFQQTLLLDPQDSRAALFLGRAYSALYDETNAALAMKRAIDIDPDYYEARTSYAAVLLDTGDFDEAIRQLDLVTRRQPKNGMAWYLLSQAYVRKGSYPMASEAGRTATQLTPGNAEAHLWYAEALRLQHSCTDGVREYQSYLSLSNFDSKALGKVNYYLLGSLIGRGRKTRAAQADIWRELHIQAKVGICDCDWMLHRLGDARQSCTDALTLDQQDAFANYRLGLVEAELYNAEGSLALLAAARRHFGAVIAANPDMIEAERARAYIAKIDAVLLQLK